MADEKRPDGVLELWQTQTAPFRQRPCDGRDAAGTSSFIRRAVPHNERVRAGAGRALISSCRGHARHTQGCILLWEVGGPGRGGLTTRL